MTSEAAPQPVPEDEAAAESFIDSNRVTAFSDGIFAFAATLLVLSIEVPSSSSGLGDALLDEQTNLFAYALSFAILGNFWLDHHKLFGRLTGVNGAVIWLNLLYLALIALVPFTCELIGEHGDQAVGVGVYAADMVAVSVAYWLLVRGAMRSGLVSNEPNARQAVADAAFGGLVLAAVFAFSIVLAVVISPEAATWSYLSLFAVIPLSYRIRGSRLG